jgi:hypothetical protein
MLYMRLEHGDYALDQLERGSGTIALFLRKAVPFIKAPCWSERLYSNQDSVVMNLFRSV